MSGALFGFARDLAVFGDCVVVAVVAAPCFFFLGVCCFLALLLLFLLAVDEDVDDVDVGDVVDVVDVVGDDLPFFLFRRFRDREEEEEEEGGATAAVSCFFICLKKSGVNPSWSDVGAFCTRAMAGVLEWRATRPDEVDRQVMNQTKMAEGDDKRRSMLDSAACVYAMLAVWWPAIVGG